MTVLQNNRKDETNNHDWVVLLSQADTSQPARSPPQPVAPSLPLPPPQPRPAVNYTARPDDRDRKPVRNGKVHQIIGDEVPF